MKKGLKIILFILLALLIIMGIVYLIDVNRMKNNEPVFFSTWGEKYAPPVYTPIGTANLDYQNHYSKIIDETTIELYIPSQWSYEELPQDENNNYKFALKIYKESSEKNVTLYFYNDLFGVCGTGRTTQIIKLDNGKEANVGYYDNNMVWWDISFYDLNPNIAIINNGLEESEANEVLDFIKTINIVTANSENSNRTPENVEIKDILTCFLMSLKLNNSL